MNYLRPAKEVIQNLTNQWYPFRRRFPNEGNVNVAIIVRYDIAHAPHLPERQRGQFCARCLGQVCGSLTDDFDTPDYSVLLFGVFEEILRRYTFHIAFDEQTSFPDVAQTTELISLHRS